MFPDLTHDDVFRLETARLWLRWPRAADAAAIVAQAGEKAVSTMTSRIAHPLTRRDVDDFVVSARHGNAVGAGLTMAITPRRSPGTVIGVVGIDPDLAGGGPHLGYWLGTEHWGTGLATEAARAMVDAFFAYTPGTELTSTVRVINPASRRVLEKCGFAQSGSALRPFPARGGVYPVDLFRLERRGWASLKAWTHSGFVPSVEPGGQMSQQLVA